MADILIFRLLDIPTPEAVSKIVNETLSLGAPLLLPPLRQRMMLLQALLPQSSTISKGQKMLLAIILRSLEDHSHVASLLGFGSDPDVGGSHDLAQVLMETLLVNLDSYSVRYFSLFFRKATSIVLLFFSTQHSTNLRVKLFSQYPTKYVICIYCFF